MAERKRYYWLKLKKDFFTSKRMKKLRKIAGGDTYTIIYLKMMLATMQDDGAIYYEGVEDTLADEIALDLDEDRDNVEVVLQFLKANDLLVKLEDDAFKLTEVDELVGKECSSTERMRRLRAKKKAHNIEQQINNKIVNIDDKASHCDADVTQCDTDVTQPLRMSDVEIEKEIEKEIDIDIDTDKEIERDTESNHNRLLAESRNQTESDNPLINTPKQTRTNYQEIVDLFHQTCKSYPVLKSLTESRKKAIKARLNKYSIDDIQTVFNKAEASDFMKGSNNRNWMANFDWMLKESNFVKILEGKYDNWEAKEKNTVFSKNKSTQDMSKEEYLKLWENI